MGEERRGERSCPCACATDPLFYRWTAELRPAVAFTVAIDCGGEWMGQAFRGSRTVTRTAALVLGCLALAHCSSGSNYSDRVVADGEPVPKGGGSYRVGKPYVVNGRTYSPKENPSYRAEGIASWYGPDFHGRMTANGEVYDMHAISAAHPTMPLPSYARVTNLDNGRSIIVRVNDRGPYSRNRIVDVSIGTAKALNFYGKGLARVRVDYVGLAPIEGTDDAMLLATLREGSPAPAPSKVMVAAAKPFLPGSDKHRPDTKKAEGKDTPLRSERPYSLAAASTRSADEMRAGKSGAEAATRSPILVRSASADPRMGAPAASTFAAPAPSNDGPMMGLMSGRGLY
jgi:rare lipoprotein A